jgi:hypothetical protein
MTAKYLIVLLSLLFLNSLAIANEDQLKRGQAIWGPDEQECESLIEDGIEELCKKYSSSVGCNASKSCRKFKRQIFMGSMLKKRARRFTPRSSSRRRVPTLRKKWNGAGGPADAHANALMCSLRELSPQLNGPLRSGITIDLGIGKMRVFQEIGFRSFTVRNPVFKGYRKIVMDLPVLGKMDAVTQDITIKRKHYYHKGTLPMAGGQAVDQSYAIDVSTHRKTKSLNVYPPGFDVSTPYGPIRVNPAFKYRSNAPIVNTPLNSPHYDIPKFMGGNTVRLFDIYGLNEGIKYVTKKVNPRNFTKQRTGWTSQLGLGSRGALLEDKAWKPASGPVLRPELSIQTPRSSEEKLPSLYTSAQAQVVYPKNIRQILPAWVFSMPGLRTPTAYIYVTPKIEVGLGGELLLWGAEGTDHVNNGEFDYKSNRLQSSGVLSRAHAKASFNVDAGLVIKIKVKLPALPTKTLVNINQKFNIPITGNKKVGTEKKAIAWSTSRDSRVEIPDQIDLLDGFFKDYRGKSEVDQYFKKCFDPKLAPPVADVPKTTPEKGNAADLFGDRVLWPCNICIAIGSYRHLGRSYGGKRVLISKAVEKPKTWSCNVDSKSGCMNLCTLDKRGKLHIARTPRQIYESLPANDPNRQVFGKCSINPPR